MWSLRILGRPATRVGMYRRFELCPPRPSPTYAMHLMHLAQTLARQATANTAPQNRRRIWAELVSFSGPEYVGKSCQNLVKPSK